MARFSSLRRRALQRAAVGVHEARTQRASRLRWGKRVLALGLTLAALVMLLRTGSSLLSIRLSPFPSSDNTATDDANSPAAIARDYYSAYQGTPPPPLQVPTPQAVRFGSLAPRAIGAPSVKVTGGIVAPDTEVTLAGRDTQLLSPAPDSVSPLPPFATLIGNGQHAGGSAETGDGLALSGLPSRELVAQGEVGARDAAEKRQLALLHRFLRVSQASETAALQSDVTEAKRSLADAVRAAGQLDLGPLPIELPDAEIQLEMTNLRLKLTPGLRLAPGEREAAAARLQLLEAEWNARLAAQRNARSEEIERLRNERPREVNQEGTRQLDAETQAAQARIAQERQKIAAQLEATIRQDAAQDPLRLTLPSVRGTKQAKPAPQERSPKGRRLPPPAPTR